MKSFLKLLYLIISLSLVTNTFGQNCEDVFHFIKKNEFQPTSISMPIATDSKSNFIIGDEIEPTSSVNLGTNGQTTYNSYLRKYNSNGDLMWTVLNEGENKFSFENIKTDKDDNIIISGFYYGTVNLKSSKSGNFLTLTAARLKEQNFIAKYTPEGDILWAKNAGASNSWEYMFPKLFIDDLGNSYIRGKSEFPESFGDNTINLPKTDGEETAEYLAKFNKDGNVLWVKKIPSTYLPDFVVDNSENIYFITKIDYDLIKYNKNGELIESKKIYSSYNHNHSINGVRIDGYNNIYLIGILESKLIISKYSTSESSFLWEKTYLFASPKQMSVNRIGQINLIVLIGEGPQTTSAIKIKEDGILDWQVSIDGTRLSLSNNNQNSDFYITGWPSTHVYEKYGIEANKKYFAKICGPLPPCPELTITNLPDKVCTTFPTYEIKGIPSPGTFSGSLAVTTINVSSGLGHFSPSKAEIGSLTITYTASNVRSGCTNTATKTISVSSYNQISGLPAITCETITDAFTLEGSPAGGIFSVSPSGGLSSNKFTPSVAGKGTKIITYTVPNSSCSAATAQIYVAPKPYKIDHVLSASATSFSDNWPLDYTNVNVLENNVKSSQKIYSMFDNPFKFGSKGVWRAEESYTYVNERKQTINSTTSKPEANTRKDGTMDNVALFDWASGFMTGCANDWRKVNTMTKYNTSNYEVENRNIQDNYSAALYGYNGDQTVAVAQNAKFNEIGYEGLEEFLEGEKLIPLTPNVGNGNITFFTAVPAASEYLNWYKEYEVLEADGNKLTVKMALNNSMVGASVNLFGANVISSSPEVNSFNNKNIYLSTTIKSISLITAGLCLVEVNESVSGIWKGKIQVRTAISSSTRPKVSIGAGVKLFKSGSNLQAHTGNMMIGVLGNVEMEQYKMSFIPGKSYFFSSWLSYGNGMAETFKSLPSATQKRGVQFTFLNSSGATISSSSVLIEPSGPVIEKWQKLEGEFLVPEGTARVVMKISAPYASTTDYTYLDDIRIMPFDANMQTYVYDKVNLKLRAVLDNNNFATLYYYDKQGNLFLNKKETERGIQTLQEVFFHQKE